MRNLKRVSLVSLVSVALLGTMALPASAAPSDATDITVTVNGGALSITSPTGTAATTPGSDQIAPGAQGSITLTGVTVSDTRAVVGQWDATVTLSAFSNQGASVTMTPDAAIYAATAAAVSPGGPTMASVSDVPVGLVGAAVQTASDVIGNNTATWNALLTIDVPAQALADDYTATLTHSIS